MSDPMPGQRPPKKKMGPLRRKAATVSAGELVKTGQLRSEGPLPALWTPAVDGVDVTSWAVDHRDLVDRRLLEHGAILFRGFGVTAPEHFENFVEAVSGETLEYRERSTPRSQVLRNIYTSTDYPAEESIFPHNENSYQQTFPVRLLFCCHTQPDEGGETPIVDCRRVYRRIPPEIRQRFVDRQIMYVRNFGSGMGLTWQSVFQTEDRDEVEAYCRRAQMDFEWKADNRLRIRRILPAVTRHPETGEELWFNHATFFHVTTLSPQIRDTLLTTFDEEDLPNNTYYGDGTPIEAEVLDRLRQIYLDERVIFPWRRGDILLLDNMLTAHAREPYRGSRKILTGMTRPCTRD